MANAGGGNITERVAFYDNSLKHPSTGAPILRRLPYNLVRYDHEGWGVENVARDEECLAGPGTNLRGVWITDIKIVSAPDGHIPGGPTDVPLAAPPPPISSEA